MSSRPRFVLSFLAWSSGLSGGDRHLLEAAGGGRGALGRACVRPLVAHRGAAGVRPLWGKRAERAALALPRGGAALVSASSDAPAPVLGARGFARARTAVGVDVGWFPPASLS